MATHSEIFSAIAGQFILLFLGLLAGAIPTLMDIRRNLAEEKRPLNTWGKIVAVTFISLLIASGIIIYKDKKAELENEFKTEERWKSDSLRNAKLTIEVNTLNERDSSFIAALKKGGYKFDPIRSVIIVPKNNVQNIESGASGLQSNAPNYGLQAGRDLYYGTERIYSDEEIKQVISSVKWRMKKYKLNRIVFSLAQGSNASKIVLQLKEKLSEIGYDVDRSVAMSMDLFEGISLVPFPDPAIDGDSCLWITLGTIPFK